MYARTLSRFVARTLTVRTAASASRAASTLPRAAFRPASASVAAAAAAATACKPALKSASRRATAAAFGTLGAVGLAGLTVSVASASTEVDPGVTSETVAAAAAAVESLLDREENENLGPTLVRLAWHASGTYDKESGTGGSEGATMRFMPESDHGANAGLSVARNALEPIKKLFPEMTYSDLWTLAGAVAIEYMGGPKIVWRPGRRDAVDGAACTPDGRLPDADKGKVGETIRHVREIFMRQGFNDREIVALVGAHTLGRCHTDRSGYTGPWTRAPTTFSNLYFKELVENTWTLKQWDGPDQFEDPSGDLMMLPADMALLWDKDFRKYVVEFAKDEEMFFQSFATAFQKLEENGVGAFAGEKAGKPWYQFW